MAFLVGDKVVVQKKGGTTGTKAISPEFNGVVVEVLAGSEYVIDPIYSARSSQRFEAFFQDKIVAEADMVIAP